ncbi:MAG: homocysteine S-methyltransferase family protein [Thermomicrobiales bacterium]
MTVTDILPEPVLLDGGMGRELGFRGVEVSRYIWSAQALLDAPDVVREIHADYIAAGADIITTNTYCTLRSHLDKAGVADRYEELNRLAGALAVEARESADRPVLIAGSLAPMFESYRPDMVLPAAESEPVYREQAAILADYVDMFICETMSKSDEAVAAARAAAATGKPVWVSFNLHPSKHGYVRSGETIGEAVAALDGIPVSGFLANCCMPELIEAGMPELVNTGSRFVGGYANTFLPTPDDWTLEENDLHNLREDLEPPAYLEFVEAWLDKGATVVGGCCGTRPAHIRAIANVLGR